MLTTPQRDACADGVCHRTRKCPPDALSADSWPAYSRLAGLGDQFESHDPDGPNGADDRAKEPDNWAKGHDDWAKEPDGWIEEHKLEGDLGKGMERLWV